MSAPIAARGGQDRGGGGAGVADPRRGADLGPGDGAGLDLHLDPVDRVGVRASEDVVAAVVRVTEARSWSPVLARSTGWLMVSPATRPVTGTASGLVAPAAPRAILTVPEATAALAAVVEVKVPKVPSPATLAAAPTRTVEARTLPPVVVRPKRIEGAPSSGAVRAGRRSSFSTTLRGLSQAAAGAWAQGSPVESANLKAGSRAAMPPRAWRPGVPVVVRPSA